MTTKVTNLSTNSLKRVLVVSQREIVGKDLIANSLPFEFEDWIASMDMAEVITPRRCTHRTATKASATSTIGAGASAQVKSSLKRRVKSALASNSLTQGAFKAVRKLIWSTPLNHFSAPKVEPIALEHEYDLLYVILTEPWEIFNLRAIPNWREKCRYAVCHFVELWQKEVDDLELLRKEYEGFDKIYSNTFFTTEEISAATGRACEYLPFTVDVVKLCPYPNPPERCIDVSYIGRRSSVTHQALLKLAETESFFYLYDTAKNFCTSNHSEHRSLLANQLKRTRYFFANRSKVNDPSSQGRQQEFGWRFFEGLAAGTVILGTTPNTEVFKQYFNWQDAVIELPFEMENIADVIAALDGQPERLARIRHDNMVNALQRYDWLHTWQVILESAGMTTTLAMQRRAEKLQELLTLVEAEFAEAEWHGQNCTGKYLKATPKPSQRTPVLGVTKSL